MTDPSKLHTMKNTVLLGAAILTSVAAAGPTKAQQAVLNRYLKSNPEYQLFTPKDVPTEFLRGMRELWGKNFEPHYKQGDFNGDRKLDFAVIVWAPKKEHPAPGMQPGQGSVYPQRVLIFNGIAKNRYQLVYIKNFEAGENSLLRFDAKDRDPVLYWGEYGTDWNMIFRPNGKTYRQTTFEDEDAG